VSRGEPLTAQAVSSQASLREGSQGVEPGWELTVGPEGEGERLDRLVARRIPRLSRARAARLEVIDLDEPQRILKKSAKLRAGQRLWVRRPPPDEDLSELQAPRVIEEGGGLIVIDKPPGWAAHPTASRYEATLTTWLKRRGTPAAPAHRLDVETSGLVVCATELSLEQALKAQFKAHRVHKVYLAVCEGLSRALPEGGEAPLQRGARWREERALGFDPHSEVRLKMGLGALSARTDFEVVALAPDAGPRGRALIKARPRTGRQHQLRAHLSLSGLPIVGDKLYGGDEGLFLRHLHGALSAEDHARLGHARHALHAASLSCELMGVERAWRSPLPPELEELMAPLERT